jgi:hypothetical protein
MKSKTPPFKYGSEAWVRRVLDNPAIDNKRLSQMAHELRQAGQLKAMLLIHKEIKLRIDLSTT